MKKTKATIIFLLAFVMIVSVAIVSIAKENDKVEDKLVTAYNKEFQKENNLNKTKEFRKGVKISERIQVKAIEQLDGKFLLVDSKEKFETVFILDENNNAVGISIVLNGEIQTIAETEAGELLKLCNSLPAIYENEKKIKIYSLPGFVAFSVVIEKSDGSFDVWPSQEVCTNFISDVNMQAYQRYSLEEFFKLLTEQKIINDSWIKDNNGDAVY